MKLFVVSAVYRELAIFGGDLGEGVGDMVGTFGRGGEEVFRKLEEVLKSKKYMKPKKMQKHVKPIKKAMLWG